jgi:3-dehydroquinate dehydratase II
MSKLLVLHGPNLNLLGTREPSVYGTTTLAEINQLLQDIASAAGMTLEAFQSNSEGALVDRVQAAKPEGVGMIVINPGAYTHTSIALRDAFAAVAIPFIEVHLSNVHAREEFRQKSYLSDVAVGVITGLGADGYQFAVEAAIRRLKRAAQTTQNHQ